MQNALRLLAATCLLAAPLGAAPQDPSTLFAQCAGRLAATIEQGWLTGRHDTRLARLKRDFDVLTDAALPGSGVLPPATRAARIEAKAHQAFLLRMAAFHADHRRARLAAAAARDHRARCLSLLLGAG
ncbi:hypothetical protein [Roseivivax isoporae]|uniref:Lysozyme inhibitor LprI N-terminal domain-containing protein n=1 Tax=Roseivivax isoporae LMG 25204 TaxID=1449351 RepID=X7F603_9RHOB|nr:hypothetical protein [Roseivivax isoporae]ETX28235.1 hypothetical protein RISW2_08975 [Roseivivax isoporae LMG 25204]